MDRLQHATHQYEATGIASTNASRIAEAGGFDEKTNQFELKAEYPLGGDTWHQRTVINEAADTMRTSYLSFGAVPGEGRGDRARAAR